MTIGKDIRKTTSEYKAENSTSKKIFSVALTKTKSNGKTTGNDKTANKAPLDEALATIAATIVVAAHKSIKPRIRIRRKEANLSVWTSVKMKKSGVIIDANNIMITKLKRSFPKKTGSASV